MKKPQLWQRMSLRSDQKFIKPSSSLLRMNPRHLLSEFSTKKYQVILTTEQTHQLVTYHWRSNTQFPIVKVLHYTQREDFLGKHILNFEIQNYLTRLDKLKDIPCFKILYLLKQSIIGFQRLYDKFGGFPVNAHMIAINEYHKCKVWLNQEFEKNNFVHNSMSQNVFLQTIIEVIAESANKQKLTACLFTKLKYCSSFYQSLTLIQSYAKENKINIPNCCRISPKDISSKEKQRLSFKSIKSERKISQLSLRNTIVNSSRSKFNFKPFSRFPLNKSKSSNNFIKEHFSKKTDTSEINNSFNIDPVKSQYQNKKQTSNQVSQTSIKNGLVSCSSKLMNQIIKPGSLQRKFLSQQLIFQQQELHTPRTPQFLNSNQKDQRQYERIVSKVKEAQILGNNKWKKVVTALFSESRQLRQSIVVGPERKKTEKCHIKLDLLDALHKHSSESVMLTHRSIQEQIREPKTNFL